MTRQFGISFETLSRRADATGISHPPGSHGVTQYYAENVIPLPSRSILAADIAPLEPIDLAEARSNEARSLALLFSLFLWDLFALVLWALFF